jgi:hypothetical protein
MEPEPITLDKDTAAKLAGANGHSIPLHAPDGGVVAYGVSPWRLEKLEEAYRARIAELDRTWPPEELARIRESMKNDKQPTIPHEQVMRWIESL